MPDQFNPIQRFQSPSFPDQETNPLQEMEVKSRLQEYNRRAGIMPVYEEKVEMPVGFIDRLMDGSPQDSFEAWNLLRRGRMNVMSVTIDRKEGIVIEQARSSNDIKRVEGQCKTLLYGKATQNKEGNWTGDCFQAWLNIDKNVLGFRIDVRQPYVTAVKGATD